MDFPGRLGAPSLDVRPKVLIAHKDPLARAYLRDLIGRSLRADRPFEAESFNAVVDLLKVHNDTQLAIVDIDLPGMATDLGFQFFGAHYESPRFAALISKLGSDRVERLLKAGVAGCIPKNLPEPELVAAFRSILDGGTYVPSMGDAEAALMFPEERQDFLHQELTERQGEVLQLLALGHSNREIGQLLNIAEGTVKVHVNAAFRVLGVHNRVSAAAAIRQRMDEILLGSGSR